MPPRNSAPGHCAICHQAVDKSKLRSHLDKCLAQHVQNVAPAAAFLLEVRALPYWLAVMARADATLADLDGFLREIWLECCEHLSAFTIEGEQYGSQGFDEDGPGLDVSLADLLSAGQVFGYDYDFETSTSLELKVLREQSCRQAEPIKLMARNDAPEIDCQECDRPATRICGECIWSGEGALCEACAADHDCAADAILPMLNSPRCGICGYTGPQLAA